MNWKLKLRAIQCLIEHTHPPELSLRRIDAGRHVNDIQEIECTGAYTVFQCLRCSRAHIVTLLKMTRVRTRDHFVYETTLECDNLPGRLLRIDYNRFWCPVCMKRTLLPPFSEKWDPDLAEIVETLRAR